MRGSWLLVAMVCACGPTREDDTAGDGPSSDDTSGDAGGTSSGGLDLPASRCGDGIVDPGEACDDGDDGCDACTAACMLPVEPELAWTVPLAPFDRVWGFDLTQEQRAWVVGETLTGEILLQRIEGSGLTSSVDLTALAGFASVAAFHVNGVTGEVGVLGSSPDSALMFVRAGGDGPIGEPLMVTKEVASQHMAITSVGLSFAVDDEVTTLSWTGEPQASFSGPSWVRFIDAMGDRLAVGGTLVTLVDPDGANPVETSCAGQGLATSGTHVLFDGSDPFEGEEAIMGSCELASGESVSEVVARGAAGYHVGPSTQVVDVAPNGNPLGGWSVCPSLYSVMGCDVPRERGFGGPGEPETIELDGCDEPRQARLGSDRGVYMIRRDRKTGALSLVRRHTLPVAPPWG